MEKFQLEGDIYHRARAKTYGTEILALAWPQRVNSDHCRS